LQELNPVILQLTIMHLFLIAFLIIIGYSEIMV
jgi:hypothetical protein